MFSSSILENGKLKPGVYKIQNLAGQTYVEMQESTKELCGRPATALSTGEGLVRFSARVFESRLSCSNLRCCDARPDGLDDVSVVGFSTFRARLHYSKGEEETAARPTNRDLPADQINETLGRIQAFVQTGTVLYNVGGSRKQKCGSSIAVPRGVEDPSRR